MDTKQLLGKLAKADFADAVGLALSSTHVTLAHVRKRLHHVQIADVETRAVEVPPEGRAAFVVGLLRDFIERRDLADVRLGVVLDGRDVLHARLQLPATAAENFESVVRYELDRMFPVDPGSLVVSPYWRPLGTNGERMHAVVVAARRERIDAIHGDLVAAGLAPNAVTAAQVALNDFYYFARGMDAPRTAGIFYDDERTQMVVSSRGYMVSSATYDPRIESRRERLWRELETVVPDAMDDEVEVVVDGEPAQDEIALGDVLSAEALADEVRAEGISVGWREAAAIGAGLALVGEARAKVNLLPAELARVEEGVGLREIGLSAVVIALSIVLAGMIAYKNLSIGNALASEVERLLPKVTAVQRQEQANRELLDKIKTLESHRKTPVLAYLRAMTEKVPQTAYLTTFRYKGDRIEVDGIADNAAELIALLEETYCRTIGVELAHMDEDARAQQWLIERMERTRNHPELSRNSYLHLLTKLTDAEIFERFLHTKFVGAKRFSLEGGESLIPLLEFLIYRCAKDGVEEVVIGMAHRGRLNVLANVLEKPVEEIFAEFADEDAERYLGRGDVKYHLGYAQNRDVAGQTVHLSLTYNPSHLEFVDPVVVGRVRAKQDRYGDAERRRVLPLLIHGDAAFCGQGVVAELLNMSELEGFCVGGTVHVIVNNQIGFTTEPREARSTRYPTDVAKMLQAPIFHVNGEDPEAVVQVVRLAVDFRDAFQRDAIIDLWCYRRHGHNEGDEPAYTQPVMYERIKHKPTIREQFVKRLTELGVTTAAEAKRLAHERRQALEEEAARLRHADRLARAAGGAEEPCRVHLHPVRPRPRQLPEEHRQFRQDDRCAAGFGQIHGLVLFHHQRAAGGVEFDAADPHVRPGGVLVVHVETGAAHADGGGGGAHLEGRPVEFCHGAGQRPQAAAPAGPLDVRFSHTSPPPPARGRDRGQVH